MKWQIRKCRCESCGGQWWMRRGTSPRFYVDSFADAISEAARIGAGKIPGNPRRPRPGPYALAT